MLLSQSVAVACRRRRVIGRAIALDRQDHAPGLGGVLGSKIDSVARSSVLAKAGPPLVSPISDIPFERVELRDRGGPRPQPSAVARSVREIAAGGRPRGLVSVQGPYRDG